MKVTDHSMVQPSKQTELVFEYYLHPFPMEHVAEPDRIVVTCDKADYPAGGSNGVFLALNKSNKV